MITEHHIDTKSNDELKLPGHNPGSSDAIISEIVLIVGKLTHHREIILN